MSKKKALFLASYFDFDSLFPQDYFELFFQESAHQHWLVYFVDDQGETVYGPYNEDELLERLCLAPFLFEEIVLVYHLIESKDDDLKNLGVRLLKKLV